MTFKNKTMLQYQSNSATHEIKLVGNLHSYTQQKNFIVFNY